MSEGWLTRFLNRYGLVLRVPTTVCQKPPIEYAQKLVDFILYVSKMRLENELSHIYACDETSFWLDPAGGKCVAKRGSQEVGHIC